MKQRYLVLLFLSIPFFTYAQRDYQRGYIIRSSGDTLRGEIRYTERSEASLSCCFRSGPKAAVTCYQPDELRGYGFESGRIYESTLLKEALVFMQVLADGKARLLKYNQQYYAKKAPFPLLLLESRDTLIYRNNFPYKGKGKEFVTVLRDQLMADCPAVEEELNRSILQDSDLIRVFSLYNNCHNLPVRGGKRPNYAASSKLHVSVGLGASWNQSTLQLGHIEPAGLELLGFKATLRPENALIPNPALWLLISQPRASQKFSLQTGLGLFNESFRYANSETTLDNNVHPTTESREAYLQFRSLRIPLLLRYTFTGKKIFPYIAAGPSLIAIVGSESMITVERVNNKVVNLLRYPFFNPRPSTFAFAGVAGLRVPFSSKIQGFVEARYERPTDSIARPTVFDRNKYPYAVAGGSIVNAPYRAMQLSIGLLYR